MCMCPMCLDLPAAWLHTVTPGAQEGVPLITESCASRAEHNLRQINKDAHAAQLSASHDPR